MVAASVSICERFNLLNQETITRLKLLPKEKRTVQMGLLQKNDKVFSEQLLSGIKEIRRKFLETNKLDESNVLSLHSDAVIFFSRKKIASVIDGVEFKKKHTWSSYLRYKGIEMFYGDGHITYKNIPVDMLNQHTLGINKYLIDVANGKDKINANSMFLYDIIHAYEKEADVNCYYMPPVDNTLESLWTSQKKPKTFSDTLVVRDGSYSMTERVSKNVSAMEIGDSIALYCAKNNTGVFKDKIMAFSNNPKMITVNCSTLRDNIEKLMKNTACSTTNVESVFDLILKTAKKCNAEQKDMPKNVLIISDMQFNAAMCDKDAFGFPLYNQNIQEDDTLFENIEKKYNACGYELPKLIFWNVSCYNDGTVPIQSSRNGIILLSGFSKELVDMVCCSDLDPYKALCKQLNKPRYDVVEEIFKYC